MSYIEVEPGVSVFVRDIHPQGEKTIVWIHGWPLDHRTFEYQYDVFPEYGYRCVGIDLRGFGHSDKPWKGYSYNRLSDDILAVVKALHLDQFVLAGHSMGGAISIRYMARHAGYGVSKLVLMAAAAPSFMPRPGSPYGMTKEQVDGLFRGLYKDRPQILSQFGMMFFGRPITPGFGSWFQDIGLEAAGYATIKTLESLRDEDVRPDFASIHVPTGIFHGVLDEVCPFPLGLETNQGIQHSTLYRFDHSGHAVYYDELEQFNYALYQFLG